DGARLEELDVVELDRCGERVRELPHGTIGDARHERLFGQAEVALVVAYVEPLDREADQRAEPDLGEGDPRRVAPLELLARGQRGDVLLELGIKDNEVELVAELNAQGERDGLRCDVAVAVLERETHAVSRREADPRI